MAQTQSRLRYLEKMAQKTMGKIIRFSNEISSKKPMLMVQLLSC